MSENIATLFAIEANCHNPGGTSIFPAKLDLNACITVDKDSKLVWGSGHAGDLCTGCIAGKADINKSYITCRCALNGDTQSASGVTSTLELGKQCQPATPIPPLLADADVNCNQQTLASRSTTADFGATSSFAATTTASRRSQLWSPRAPRSTPTSAPMSLLATERS